MVVQERLSSPVPGSLEQSLEVHERFLFSNRSDDFDRTSASRQDVGA
jgi:hypothetical protein